MNIKDYDGDELNFTPMLDNLVENEFKSFAPFYNIPDTSKPYSVSGNLTLLAPANSTIANYLSDARESDSLDTILSQVATVAL